MATILVVDDQAENIAILDIVLSDEFVVHGVQDGSVALDYLKAGNKVDLILLDVMMPGMNGFDVCRHLKESPDTRAIPVIFLTSLDKETDEELGLGLGAADFIRKPFTAAVVQARVRHHMELCLANRALHRQAEDLEAVVAERTRQISQQAKELRSALDALTISHAAQKRLTKELRERVNLQDYLVTIADAIPGIICCWQINSDGTVGMPYASPNIYEIYGYTAAEVREDVSIIFGRLHPDDRESLRSSLSKATLSMDAWWHEYRVLHPLKGEIWVEGRALPELSEDGSVLFHGFIHDVTERHNMEIALRHSQKMESLGQLTGGLAHDFANILGIISANLQLIEYNPCHENLSEGVKTGLAAVDRGAKLVRRLHALSRRQAEGIGSCDVRPEIEKIQALVLQTLPKNISLDISVADDLWWARMDPGEFGDALINLVINSTHAMPDGGRITITANNVLSEAPLPDRPSGTYVMILVEDSGAGIPAHLLGRVFEPFFTTKEKSGGSGLGLAMVYGFAKRSGGSIQIESKVGKGTKVRLYLPGAADRRAAAREETDRAGIGHGGETILVVDDETGILEAVAPHLRSLGYRVLTAENPKAALAILDVDKDVALLFSDIVMPGPLDGVELARRATKLNPKIGILLSTGFAGSPQEPGEHDFEVLSKPYRMTHLCTRLRAILDASAEPLA